MPSCVIKCCKINSSYHNKDKGITFHKFPTETKWKDKWVRAVRINRNDSNWLPSQFSVVCSVHFEESDKYITQCGTRRIKKTAFPKKILLINSEWCQESRQSICIDPLYIEEMNIKLEKEEIDAADNFKCIPVNIATAEEPEIHDSDLESIFDTATEHKLKEQARKYKLRCISQARKIKSLNQKVSRLTKHNTSLKIIIKQLKEKKSYVDTTETDNVLDDSDLCDSDMLGEN